MLSVLPRAAVAAALMLGLLPATSAMAKPTAPAAVVHTASAAATPTPATMADRWTTCGQTLSGRHDISCRTMRVPMDPDRPGGRMIDVGLTRLDRGPLPRRVLFVNGGGPGIAGMPWLMQFGDQLPQRLTRHFQIVAMDPRGLPTGTQLQCITGAWGSRFGAAQVGVPLTAAGKREKFRTQTAFHRRCAQQQPGLAGHMGSRATAADLEQARSLLNQRRLHYWGTSYGTLFGAAYASMFPGRVGRMALDSVVAPNRSWRQLVALQAEGGSASLRQWAAGCAERVTCPFPKAPLRRVVARIRQLDATATPEQRRSGETPGQQLVANLYMQLFDGDSYRSIDATIGATADKVTDQRLGASAGTSSIVSVQWATRCSDGPTAAVPLSQFLRWSSRVSDRYPVFGPGRSWLAPPCDTPRTSAGTGLRIPLTRGVAPVLVQSSDDPATPLRGARAMARQFPGSSLVIWQGRGHGVLERGACLNVFVPYLTHGRRPTQTTCR